MAPGWRKKHHACCKYTQPVQQPPSTIEPQRSVSAAMGECIRATQEILQVGHHPRPARGWRMGIIKYSMLPPRAKIPGTNSLSLRRRRVKDRLGLLRVHQAQSGGPKRKRAPTKRGWGGDVRCFMFLYFNKQKLQWWNTFDYLKRNLIWLS